MRARFQTPDCTTRRLKRRQDGASRPFCKPSGTPLTDALKRAGGKA